LLALVALDHGIGRQPRLNTFVGGKIRDKGCPPEEVAEAVALLRLADDVIRGRESWE
jgi:hypothetical protein